MLLRTQDIDISQRDSVCCIMLQKIYLIFIQLDRRTALDFAVDFRSSPHQPIESRLLIIQLLIKAGADFEEESGYYSPSRALERNLQYVYYLSDKHLKENLTKVIYSVFCY